MRFLAARTIRFVCFLTMGFGLLSAARADLVWKPGTGWSVEGGALAGLTGADGRNALDLMNKAREAEEKKSIGSAISTYTKVAKKYPNSIYAPEAFYRSGTLRLSRKEYIKAFEDFQSILSQYPNTKRFNDIVGEQYRIASALLEGARNRTWGWLPGFTARDRGLGYFEIIVANAPYSDYAPLALMNVAKGHHREKNIEEEIDALDRMINNYPQSLLAPDAYLKLAQAHASIVEGPYYDQASTKESISHFEDFMILFPADGSVSAAAKGLDSMKKVLAQSKIKMADFYFYKRDNYVAAKVFYNEAITAYPESDVANLAKKRLEEVEAKANGKPAPAGTEPKKKRFWLF